MVSRGPLYVRHAAGRRTPTGASTAVARHFRRCPGCGHPEAVARQSRRGRARDDRQHSGTPPQLPQPLGPPETTQARPHTPANTPRTGPGRRGTCCHM